MSMIWGRQDPAPVPGEFRGRRLPDEQPTAREAAFRVFVTLAAIVGSLWLGGVACRLIDIAVRTAMGR